MPRPLRTPRGRPLAIAGDPSVVTLDRLAAIGDRLDGDPRIASVSVIGLPGGRPGWLRATAPAGAAVVLAVDAPVITGPLAEEPAAADVLAWAAAASERGLWHDWLVVADADVVRAAQFAEPAATDVVEEADAASAHAVLADAPSGRMGLTVNIDATWLGEHETGAQVLTVAAVAALARQPGIGGITLTGIDALPEYAAHLAEIDGIRVERNASERADIAWYPNQIDARSNIAAARELGRRVVTTYLDLIAYDIPRYHADERAWQSYRALQRTIALGVDGITTISADVAERLVDEVPRLDRTRVRPIPLGLDHVRPEHVPAQAPAEVPGLVDRPFVLVLGNDFAHKNRDLAIATWQELLRRGIAVDLVLAGLHVRGSSSKDAEESLLASHVDLRGRVHRLGHVPSATRAWLLANAAAVHYPTSAEGFGFVPYEAASLGTPTTFTDFGPLREISQASGLPAHWSVEEHADDLGRLLADPAAAASRLADLRAAIAQRTWDGFARELAAFLAEIAASDVASTALLAGSSSDAARLAQVLQSRSYRIAARLQRLRPRRGR